MIRAVLFTSALIGSASASAQAARLTAPSGAAANSAANPVSVVDPLPDQRASDATPASAQDGDADRIADIVVTATRREERLQRIPVTVTAISGQGLANAGITDARSLTQAIPAVNFGRSGFIALPTIRGVGSNGISNGDESNVATYVDGVYQADAFTNFVEFVQVDRVEVLRGPQGTVFGRNATGGLINVITPDPKFETEGSIAGNFGRTRNNASLFDVRGYITGPLSEKIAADFAILARHNDGYIADLLRGGTLGKENLVDLRGKLMFDSHAGARVILTGEYVRQRSGAVVYEDLGNIQASAFPAFIGPKGPWESADDLIPRNNYEKASASLRTHFDLGGVALETTGSYQRSHIDYVQDQDASNLSIATAAPEYTTKALSQEVRLLSASGGTGFTWLLGGYVFRLTSDGSSPFGNAPNTPAGRPIPGTINIVAVAPEIATTSVAGFAEGTVQLAEPLFLTLGTRYTTERRSFEQGLLAGGVRRITIPRIRRTFDKFTYRAALRYQITPDLNLYGSYGTGFKSGVFNITTFAITPNNSGSVDPETIKAAEIGLKADITRYLRLNLSAYRYRYSNLQVSTRAPDGTFPLQNAARAKISGGEAELTVVPLDGLTIGGAVAYTHARYSAFPQAQCYRAALPAEPNFPGNSFVGCDAAGNALVRAPDWTFNVSPRYQFAAGSGTLAIGGNLFRSSRVFYDFANNFSQKPYTLVNAQAVYAFAEGLEATLKVQNMFNAVVAQQIRVSNRAVDGLLERPRQVSVGLSYRF